MVYQGFQNVGSAEGGIRYNPLADSYVVWIRQNGQNRDLTPAYGNGVVAQTRLETELLNIMMEADHA